jgi:molybdopterin-guanine dinucleotide biosynthesis protein A
MLTIAIQAGGQSSRMGKDKALVKLHGKPLIEHVLEKVHGLGDELLITTNSPEKLEYLGVRLERDRIPGAGALHGLETALLSAEGEYVLLVACDAPFVRRRLLEHLIDLRSHGDVIIPMKDGRYEPLQALYKRASCLPAVGQALLSGEKRMISFFSSINVQTVDAKTLARLDPAGISFFNINTPADLVQAEEILRKLQNDKYNWSQ